METAHESKLRKHSIESDRLTKKLSGQLIVIFLRNKLVKENLLRTQSEMSRKEREIQILKQNIEDKERKHNSMYQQLIRDSRTIFEQMAAKVKEEKESILEEARRNIVRLEEELKVSTRKVEEANQQYRNRESRPDDIETIKSLRQHIKNLELNLKTLKDEMLYYKQELLNREENFNHRFRDKTTTQKVGVLDVLNTITHNSNKVKPQESKKMRRRSKHSQYFPTV